MAMSLLFQCKDTFSVRSYKLDFLIVPGTPTSILSKPTMAVSLMLAAATALTVSKEMRYAQQTQQEMV
jgi:hypothetical protein